MDARITRHGAKRVRQRLGVPRSAVKRSAEKALRDGIGHNEASGAVQGYIATLYNAYGGAANNIRIYNGFVYIFNENILITVLILPGELRKQAGYQQKRLRRRKDELHTDDQERQG